MNVLGLHAYSHDAGACIVRGGRIFAVSQERLSRKKHDGEFPADAIKYVMELAGVNGFSEIDLAVCDSHAGSFPRVPRRLRRMGFRGEIHAVAHHDAHAASAYFTGPFEDAAVMVIDACGSFASELPGPASALAPHEFSRELHSVYAGRGGGLALVSKTFSAPGWSVGPGAMYGLGAMMCGFGDLGGGKLMALAALGGRDDLFPECAFTDFDGTALAPGDPALDPLNPENIGRYSRGFFRGVPPRGDGEPVMRVHAEIARAVQKATNAAVLRMTSHVYDALRCENLCVAGGFGLNCLTNSDYSTRTPFKNVYVQPAATDAGIPLGAALYGYHVIAGRKFRTMEFSPFTGKKYSRAAVLLELKARQGIRYGRPEDFAAGVARLIASGKICGWFCGASEFGPRALGARSILADPRDKSVREKLNTTVKRRESFRPYAPVILERRCGEFFKFEGRSPYMLLTARARPAARKLMPAVIHTDGTARLQTVSEVDNPQLFSLLCEFEKITGVPALLNTSFNRRGEPISESPGDALNCFMDTGIDFLAMEGYVVTKERSGE